MCVRGVVCGDGGGVEGLWGERGAGEVGGGLREHVPDRCGAASIICLRWWFPAPRLTSLTDLPIKSARLRWPSLGWRDRVAHHVLVCRSIDRIEYCIHIAYARSHNL